MSEKINLNVSPYFDDFNEDSNYTRVLFKPGTSIQARELTTLQTSLQNQVEKSSNAIFFDGQIVESGEISYISSFDLILLEDNFNGISIEDYIEQFENKIILGQVSGVRAKVLKVLKKSDSEKSRNTLYIKYLSSSTDFSTSTFLDSENIITESTVATSVTTFFQNNSVARCISNQSIGKSSGISINEGVAYIRGFFVKFQSSLLLLDQYSTTPSYRIGFTVTEKIIKSLDDPSLNDNARGFSNFSAPGADRLQITCKFSKKSINEKNVDNFLELLKIEDGTVTSESNQEISKLVEDELARRTFDESGDYIVNEFNLSLRESLNNLVDKDGFYFGDEKTYNNNKPSEDLSVLSVSPGKAFVRGYEIEKISTTLFDVEKARDSKEKRNCTLPINFGKSFKITNIEGNLDVGVNAYYAEIRDRRKESNHLAGSGSVIGHCRIYDFKLLESYEDDSTEGQLYFYDLQFFTKLLVSSNITSYSVGSQIKGLSSGAIGYVRGSDGLTNNPGGSDNFTLYQISGKFLPGEKYSVNGVEDSRLIKEVIEFGNSNAKSLRIVGSARTFTSDFDLSNTIDVKVNNSFKISEGSGFAATVTSSNDFFVSSVKVNDILQYTNPGFSTVSYNRVTGITTLTNEITLASVPTVNGVCVGSLPTSDLEVSDLSIARTEIEKGTDTGLYASLPNNLISDIDTDFSTLRVRKQYNVSISSNSGTVNEGSTNLTFLPFFDNRYLLQYSDGTIEKLNSNKVVISGDGRTLTFRSLDKVSDVSAKLIATLVKTSLKNTTKIIKRCETLILNDSTLVTSGTGENTLNDGLSYDPTGKYGIRVQDNELCLNHPEVLTIRGVFQSSTTGSPKVPTIELSNSQDLSESIIGEEFFGEISKSVGVVLPSIPGQSNTSDKVNFIFVNDRVFIKGEKVTFKSSGINGTVSNITFGDKDIKNEYNLDNGQRDDFYDYSRLVRKNGSNYVPTNRLLIVYDRYDNTGTTQDFVNIDSYSYVDYERDLFTFNSKRNSDIIDFRPRVSFYNKNIATFGPFHYLNRTFAKNNSSITVVDDESITLNYSYYVPRIDKLVLTKDGVFEYKKGAPDTNPQPPLFDETSLDVATLYYPAYTFNTSDVKIDISEHKRYTMKDLRNLESRVENLELYTTLSLLESETNNLKIEDALTGIDKFKSGFFVDSFINNTSQDLSNPAFSCSIDKKLGELRPPYYTTSLDLILGSKSFLGIGTEADPDIDISQAKDLESDNLQRTGNIITLKYNEVNFKSQSSANSSIKVNSSNISNFSGNIKLYPSSDIWFDQTKYESLNDNTFDQFKFDKAESGPNTNFFDVEWDSWKNFWSGIVNTNKSKNINGSIDPYFWNYSDESIVSKNNNSLISSISLNSDVDTKNSKTSNNRYFNKNVSPYMRKRNISFDIDSLRPTTRFYSFIDNISIDDLIIPKFIEIEMIAGAFTVGEDVLGFVEIDDNKGEVPTVNFRLSSTNHMSGSYNNPSEVYEKNPYDNTVLQSTYSQTSTVLNVDLQSLSSMMISKYYGQIQSGMILVGKSSGAQAKISDIRLISNDGGILQGIISIPNPSGLNKKFLTGKKTILFNSDKFNSALSESSFAEIIFESSGFLPLSENGSISVRNTSVEKKNIKSNTITNSFITNVYENNEFQNNLLRDYNYANPLVQTFVVNEPSGIYLTSIDLFVKSKDTNLPLNIEIRPIKNNLPTSTSVPFSKVSLLPSKVTTSADSSLPTNFKFESPIYIQPNQIYGIIIYSDSDEYEIYTSNFNDVGTLDLIDGTTLSKSSSIGNLLIPNNIDINIEKNTNIKLSIYKAKFVTNTGTLTLYNPNLDIGNGFRPKLKEDPFICFSRRNTLTLDNLITTVGVATIGYQITQADNLSATGILVKTGGKVGLGTTTLTVSSVGTGLTPTSGTISYPNLNFTTLTGNGSGLVGLVSVTNGSIDYVDVTNGGSGYLPNDVVTAEIGNTGTGFKFSVGIRTAITKFILDDVQGKFNSTGNLMIRNVATGTTSLFVQTLTPTSVSDSSDERDGLHMIVNHTNHFMNSKRNDVELFGAQTDLPSLILSSEITETDTSIQLNSVTNLSQFEGIGIGTTNAGYVKINEELIKYESITGNSLSNVTRGIDQTKPVTHKAGALVKKYEMNGVSLRRINTRFNLSDVTTSKQNTGDSYYLKVGIDTNGTDRTGFVGLPRLSFIRNTSAGRNNVTSTQNIQFESITPNVQIFVPTSCNINSSVRTITGTSDGGNEFAFSDKGFEALSLTGTTVFNSPRLITSRINELEKLSNLPGRKSLSVRMEFTSNDENVSPILDLDRCNMIFTSNLINNPVSDFTLDSRVNSLSEDPNKFIYLTKQIDLNISANSLKVILDAYKPSGSNIRVLYKLITEDKDKNSEKFVLFPGYSNLDLLGNVVNSENSDGTSDVFVNNSNPGEFKEHIFTANNLEPFLGFVIKIIMTGTNSADVPKIKNLRGISLS